ncbi:hypothetical protein [uncultured Cohaesibacter sp.]|uniref:hypothetical protein n=1 Tax=uncultured Cohaesibacter sp. TaxID=1002546 RepID=UPI0029C82A0F|nr:hypothetical protein [uncultured Cohaesibacter sp.]
MFGFGWPSLAADLPRYDPQGHCKKVASFGGDYSAMLDNSCLEIEQAAYNSLKAVWADFSGASKSHCDRVARFGGQGSYSLLKSCIEMEERAAGNKQEFKF